MNIVIYARYSSHTQTEQSIEGQLETCYEYAKSHGHTAVGEYIDRAQSGTTDNRTEFQRMIADSDKHFFEAILVYQLDRFARNRYDSAINKAKLKKNGVRVISARENISDDASGILVEGVLESMAEYYSAELSQKIRRGMSINAEKHLSNGSNPGLGYYVDAERRFHIDSETAPIVREIFEMYASGKPAVEIIKDLNARQIKTSIGKQFNKNSLHRLLKNKRYIGYYIYKDTAVPDAMPRIMEDGLFERVQQRLALNKKAPSRARAKEEYLLTTKLFCGYCREMMVGYSGTSKTGIMYYYYICKNARKKKCKKKTVSKRAIEDKVIFECRKLLTDRNIEKIVEAVAAVCNAEYDSSATKRIKEEIRKVDRAIENLWEALEAGQAVDMITERIEKRKQEKEALQTQLSIEKGKEVFFSAAQIKAFLYSLQKGNMPDESNRRGLINIFLRSVYLWDDKMTLVLNGGDKPITINDILLDEIEENNRKVVRSSEKSAAPPKRHSFPSKGSYVFFYVRRSDMIKSGSNIIMLIKRKLPRREHMKTIRLLYPDYLSGGLETYYFGAKLLAHILPENENQPLLEVKIAPPDGKERSVADGIYAKDEVVAGIRKAAEVIEAARPDRIITIGGNCIVSQAPFDYLHGIYDNVGIIWIDAHPDVSTVKDGYPNAHAMVLGSLMGHGDNTLSGLMKNKKFSADDILYVGLQKLHSYQEKFLKDMGVDYKVQTEAFLSDDEIRGFLCRFDHILIHLDIDVLDASLFHSTYFANKELVGDGSGSGRMTMEKLSGVLKCITENADVIGFTIAEYLPFDEHKLHKMFADIKIFNN